MRWLKQVISREPSILTALFLYIVAANLFQILQIYDKYPALDTAWKSLVLIGFLIYAVFKRSRPLIVQKSTLLMFFSFLLLQTLILLIYPTTNVVSMVFPVLSSFIFLILLGGSKASKGDLNSFLFLFSLFIAFAGVLNFIFNFSIIMTVLDGIPSYELALSSFFDNRNTFGFYCMLGAMAALFSVQNSSGRRRKINVLLFIFITVNLLLTLSRTSIVGLLIFLLLNLVLHSNFRLYLKTGVIIILIALPAISNPQVSQFITSNMIRSEDGSSGRDQVQTHALGLFSRSNILIGGGPSDTESTLRELSGFKDAHSTYISILLKGGLILMLLFLTLIVSSFRNAILILRKNKSLGIFLISVLVSYLIYINFETRVPFYPDVTNFTATIFVILIPLYLKNGLKINKEAK